MTSRRLVDGGTSPKTGERRYWIMVDDRRVGMVTMNRLGAWYGIKFGEHSSRGSTEGLTPAIAARRLVACDVDYWGNAL